MTKRALCTLILTLTVLAASAQHTQDFASKFMSLHQQDSTLECVTVSPKMMESLVQLQGDDRNENIVQAIAKLKSLRIVKGNAQYYEQAEELLRKNARRFEQRHDFQSTGTRGGIYTRKDKAGNTVELILLSENSGSQQLTIVNITGDIDEEFLCFLYNNKSFKD